jgi:hypothetical protein
VKVGLPEAVGETVFVFVLVVVAVEINEAVRLGV